MQCPNDGATLLMTDRLGVEIDYCPTCRGVWLDKGELDKMLERNREDQVDDTPRDYYRDDDRYERYERSDPRYRRKKRKSFLDDLFDFD